MKKNKLVVWSLAVLCVVAAGSVGAAAPEAYKFHEPADFLKMMEKSEVVYTINLGEKNLQPFNLAAKDSKPFPLNPYLRLKARPGGSMDLIKDEPSEKITQIYAQGEAYLKKRDFKPLIGLYQSALKLDPENYMTWTNLGDSYYLLENYTEAEKCFLKAIELNEIGYQAYFFLADTYFKKGEYDKALEKITYAYMLNKNSAHIQGDVERILGNTGLGFRADRLEFPFAITKKDEGNCRIDFRDADAGIWFPMANCMACWKMEAPFQALLNGKDGINKEVTMYKECLYNQVAVIATKIEKKEKITERERLLHQAIMEKHINAVIYWEILAGRMPQLILLLPKAERKDIAEYIQKYVYEKKTAK